MKKSLPFILVGLALYYYWWKMQQNVGKELPSPPQRDLLTDEQGNPLAPRPDTYTKPKLSGFPTIA